MKAEILAIGDELTSGQRVDTNSAWLSQRLGDIGIKVAFHTTVSDDEDACSRVFAAALLRADIVIATGGLGPTADDLTRQCLAQATGTELVLDQRSLDHIRSMFATRGREMPEQNEIQAMFPGGSRVVRNPHGTAPGIDMTYQDGDRTSRFFALPGVPAEMREMYFESVEPALKKASNVTNVILHHRLKCFGIGESSCEKRMPDLIRRGRIPSVGITVHKATITLRITASAESEEACRVQMQPTIEAIHNSLGSLVFGEEDDELEHVIVRGLRQRNESIATMELGTSGVLAGWVHTAAANDPCVAGGLVVGSQSALEQMVGDTASPAKLGDLAKVKVPEHSEQVQSLVGSMARYVQKKYQSTYGLAIGPIRLEDATDPEARLTFAIATETDCDVQQSRFAGHPDIVLERSGKQVLNHLRLGWLGEISK